MICDRFQLILISLSFFLFQNALPKEQTKLTVNLQYNSSNTLVDHAYGIFLIIIFRVHARTLIK